MTIKDAMRILGCENEHQLSIRLGIKYQAIQYWRKERKSKLPHPWPDVVKARAQA